MILKLSSLDQFFSLRTYLLGTYIVVLLVGFVYFTIKSKQAENPATRRIKLGYGLFGLTYALTRLFFLLSDYEIASRGGVVTQLHLAWVTAAYCVTFVSLLVIYTTVERLILHRKPILSLIAAIAFIICLASFVLTLLGVGLDVANDTGPHQIAKYTLYATGPILALGIAVLYIVIVRNSTGALRAKAVLSLVGLLLLFAGLILDMDILASAAFDPIRFVISPLLFIVGTILFFQAQK
ncbi:MAG: hypothetical protein GYA24_17515 [Candidatus Lokiarchaeota archaeon]|nr:hypothetical protein [Candidatus Lokiarchaeota archaeon]